MSKSNSYSEILKKYPSPKTNPTFCRYWDILAPEIVSREKFQLSHLFMLESLCDMYVEKQRLEDILDLVGYSYEGGEGRNGYNVRQRPEASLLARTRGEIRNYHKALGLSIKDPKDDMPDPNGEENEWD